MSAGQTRSTEAEVSANGNILRQLLVRATVIATVPALAAFLWLGLIREPSIHSSSVGAIGEALVTGRAELLADYSRDVTQRVERLAAELPADTESTTLDPVAAGFPDATAVTIIPLDELGTVNLEPGQFGLRSHIGVDVIRRAFAGENPRPEAILREDPPYTLFARPYGNPHAGVVLVSLKHERLIALAKPRAEGQFQLVQRLSGKDEQVVTGALSGKATARALVADTPWELRFSPAASWLADIVPGWVALAAALLTAFGGVIASCVVVLTGIPRAITTEVDHILESAEMRTTLKLQIPALIPLAKMLRQMSNLSRRQLVSQARRDATREDEPKPPEASTSRPATKEPPVDQTDNEAESKPADLALDKPKIDDGIPEHIFREGCIRGVVGAELSDELVEKLGQAIAVMAGEQGIQALVVAHDSRPSSKQMRTILVKTLLAGGRDVIDIGEVPTPLLHFATHETDADSGIMITGSHGPDDVNGLTLVFHRETVTGAGIQQLLSLVRAGKSSHGAGRTVKLDITPKYLDKISLDVALALPLKIVIDNDFGSAAKVAPGLFNDLDCDVVSINTPEDGPRPADWSLTSALTALGQRVREEAADIGVLFDADGDRIHAVSEQGEPVSTDRLLMLLARDVLERNPGGDVIYDVKFSRHFAPFVTRAGGRAVMSRSGQAFVRDKMRQSEAVLAGDFAGHVFIAERWYGFCDGLYATARLLELLASASESFGDMAGSLPTSPNTPELTIEVGPGERAKIMKRVIDNADFPGARVTTLDGLRVDYADGWGLVRASTTASALTLRFEGNDEASLGRVQDVLRKALTAAAPDLDLPF